MVVGKKRVLFKRDLVWEPEYHGWKAGSLQNGLSRKRGTCLENKWGKLNLQPKKKSSGASVSSVGSKSPRKLLTRRRGREQQKPPGVRKKKKKPTVEREGFWKRDEWANIWGVTLGWF